MTNKKQTVRSMNPSETDGQLQFLYGRGTPYEDETQISRTLDILCPESELECHDQRLFQIVHLNTELAWYNIHFELRHVIQLLRADDFFAAHRFCERAVLLMETPLSALEILMTTMSQISLLEFRKKLPANATGVDSPGMTNLRRITRALWLAFEDALKKMDHTPASLALLRLNSSKLPEDFAWPAKVFDEIQRLDIKLMEWKQRHLRLVWTHLGGALANTENSDEKIKDAQCPMGHKNASDESLPVMPTSLRGKPISVLQKVTVSPLFPKLWQIPDLIYQEMTKDGNSGYAVNGDL